MPLTLICLLSIDNVYRQLTLYPPLCSICSTTFFLHFHPHSFFHLGHSKSRRWTSNKGTVRDMKWSAQVFGAGFVIICNDRVSFYAYKKQHSGKTIIKTQRKSGPYKKDLQQKSPLSHTLFVCLLSQPPSFLSSLILPSSSYPFFCSSCMLFICVLPSSSSLTSFLPHIHPFIPFLCLLCRPLFLISPPFTFLSSVILPSIRLFM